MEIILKDNERIDDLQLNNLKIIQNKDGFCFGIDAVLLSDFAKDSDLFVCEGMYGSDEKRDKAEANKHMLFSEAAKTAFDANVKLLWLTHFSPALSEPEEFAEEVKKIFPETVIGRDRLSASFYFDGRVVYTD